VDVERCVDGTVSSEKLQESGHGKGSLDLAISVLYYDGLSCDRLSEGLLGKENQVGSEPTHGYRYGTIPRLETERSKAVSREISHVEHKPGNVNCERRNMLRRMLRRGERDVDGKEKLILPPRWDQSERGLRRV
jgi:hypothetical protein